MFKFIYLITFTFIFSVGLSVADAERVAFPEIKIVDLGHEKYRVGEITIDKKKRSFVVNGSLLRNELPVEFLAVSRGGNKAYESLLELETDAFNFNLACILIGLDKHAGKPSEFHFDPAPVFGSAGEIWISWEIDAVKQHIAAADIFQYEDKQLARGEWVYTGSFFSLDGQYMAAVDGVLVGFIHDPSTILEHHTGFGGGSFQGLKLNTTILPAVGTAVEVLFQFSRVIAEER